MHRLQLLLSLALLYLSVTAAVAQSNDTSGEWWLKQDRSIKVAYVLGLWAGQNHGAEQMTGFMIISVPSMKPGQKKFTPEQSLLVSFSKQVEANYINHQRRKANVSAGNYADAIDAVFSDFRFRRLQVKDVLNAVDASLSGTSEPNVQAMLEAQLKKLADGPP